MKNDHSSSESKAISPNVEVNTKIIVTKEMEGTNKEVYGKRMIS